jgi:hypothetical protein
MGIGYAEPKRLLLGAGDVYINDIFVGNAKGAVEFKYNPGYAYQRPGNSIADVKAERTSEEVTLKMKVCDFKVAQLRRAMGVTEAILSGSMTLRKQDILQLTGTSNITLGDTAVAGTMKVTKLDRSLSYVSSTDYSATSTTIARKSGGAITSAQFVIVEYDVLDTAANGLRVGGEKLAVSTFEVNFVHKLSNAKLVQITLYKAMFMSDVTLAFDEKSSNNFTVHEAELKALVDLTKPEGRNLFEIIEEDPTTAS